MSDLSLKKTSAEIMPKLTRPQKAAIIIGVLGVDAAGPILEMLDEKSLRKFAAAMSQLNRIRPEVVHQTISEFLIELDEMEESVKGGMGETRELLKRFVNDDLVARIMDDVDVPSVHNVWRKLSHVNDTALAEFLSREHPQTAAVVLSKLSAEQAAKVLSRMTPERARAVVIGITKASSLDDGVINAIGASVSEDFLAKQRVGGVKAPADRVGAIMNYTASGIRDDVIEYLAEKDPDFADEVKRKMFTFEDIPDRIDRRDISAVVRAVDQETLLRALAGAAQTGLSTGEFLLSGISTRVAEQIRGDLAELGRVKTRDAEDAQAAMLRAIRELEKNGTIKLIVPDEAEEEA